MANSILIPDSERGSNYSVAGDSGWCEYFHRARFAKKFAAAKTEATGALHTVLRESDKMVWRPDSKKWSNA